MARTIAGQRKPGPFPEYAKNQSDLGSYMTPPRDRKVIQRGLKLEGNPGRTADGLYHIHSWQEFINANFTTYDIQRIMGKEEALGQPDKRRLEEEKLRLTNEKLRFQLEVMRREYSSNADIKVWVGDMVMQARRTLQGLPDKLAPVLVGMDDIVAVNLLLKEEINSVLLMLSSRPLYGENYAAKEAQAIVADTSEGPVDAHAAFLASQKPDGAQS